MQKDQIAEDNLATFAGMDSKIDLPDGIYQIRTKNFCAGFIVEGGYVTACAPILRHRLAQPRWVRLARRIESATDTRLDQSHS